MVGEKVLFIRDKKMKKPHRRNQNGLSGLFVLRCARQTNGCMGEYFPGLLLKCRENWTFSWVTMLTLGTLLFYLTSKVRLALRHWKTSLLKLPNLSVSAPYPS